MSKRVFTEAKAKANERWRQKNKERKKYLSYRSSARGFSKIAKLEDAIEVRDLFIQKVKDLEEEKLKMEQAEQLKQDLKKMYQLSQKIEDAPSSDWDTPEVVEMREKVSQFVDEGREKHGLWYRSIVDDSKDTVYPEYMIIHYEDERDFDGYTKIRHIEPDGWIEGFDLYCGTSYLVYLRDDVFNEICNDIPKMIRLKDYLEHCQWDYEKATDDGAKDDILCQFDEGKLEGERNYIIYSDNHYSDIDEDEKEEDPYFFITTIHDEPHFDGYIKLLEFGTEELGKYRLFAKEAVFK